MSGEEVDYRCERCMVCEHWRSLRILGATVGECKNKKSQWYGVIVSNGKPACAELEPIKGKTFAP